MKNRSIVRLMAAIPVICWATSSVAAGFSSGSTGADGALSPASNVTIQLPASGVLNYTTVNIPAGVTVNFAQNVKAPVVMLATGDVNIAGTIDISGGSSSNTNVGTLLNQGGLGGPGGYDGGRGGLLVQTGSGTGFGPGGGGGGIYHSSCSYPQGGGGGGFFGSGEASYCVRTYGYLAGGRTGVGGPGYGSSSMLPLVGGSGGGGGAGSPLLTGGPGSGGGGGGGALLLVSSGKVTLTGSIQAKGGNSGTNSATGCTSASDSRYGGSGGGGAGGAVRILASAFAGSGTVNVAGGNAGCVSTYGGGGKGAPGYAGVEVVTGGTFSLGALPSLSFTSIGGVAVPPNPTGSGDVDLTGVIANPVTVEIAAKGIPVGTVVKVILNQTQGTNITADSSPLTGTFQASTATASISIPPGSTVLMATTTYTLTLAMGEALSVYAEGERVEKVRLSAGIGGATLATLITVSGKEFDVPYAALAAIAGYAG